MEKRIPEWRRAVFGPHPCLRDFIFFGNPISTLNAKSLIYKR